MLLGQHSLRTSVLKQYFPWGKILNKQKNWLMIIAEALAFCVHFYLQSKQLLELQNNLAIGKQYLILQGFISMASPYYINRPKTLTSHSDPFFLILAQDLCMRTD